MKKVIQTVCLILLVFSYIGARSQSNATSCFNTEVVTAEKVSETCTRYVWEVSYDGRCSHALSHFTAAIPCGQVKNLTNSENWKQVFGKDPKTGLTGFKIDDIPEFGTTSLKSFTIAFTLCADNETCEAVLGCWQPVIAYKASTKVYYDTLGVACNSLKASLEKTDVTCHGAADGTLSAIVTEGNEPYTYLWSNGATTADISGLAPGTYGVTVKDASGEAVTLEGAIAQPAQIVVMGNSQPASCGGMRDGALNISVSGGAGGYSYLWNTGATTEDIQALAAGTYSVVVTDASGCFVKSTFNVGNASQIIITASQRQPDCNQSNGSLDITVSGGTAPYTFLWSNQATAEDLQNLSAGIYKVTVKDSKGCTAEITFNLRENNTLKLSATTTQTSCVDDASGAIDLIVTGGTAPYSYSWTNGATTEDLGGLTSGNYTVTVTDSKGCTATLRVFVAKKSFQVPSQIVQPLCSGDSTGSIILLNPVGGEAPYTYTWSTGDTGTSITGLAPGTYSVIISDAAGCTRQLFFVIINPTPINATASISNDHCQAQGFFAIDLNVSGGKAPYTYQWSNGATTQDLDSLQSGTYTVTITDANGCSITKTITINPADAGWTCAIVQPDSIPVCGSQGNTLTTSIADADSYSWSVQSSNGGWAITGGASTGSIQYSTGGVNSSATFTLTLVKDGCTQSCSYTVTTCRDNSGGEDPGGEDPGGEDPGGEDPGGEDPGGEDPGHGNETCEECFSSEMKVVNEGTSCTTYEVTVTTNGNCRHDLSHWVIAIPCGNVKDYSNSEGWKMEFGKDPTSGVYGLKVDDIHGFGSRADSFTVTFTICGDASCNTKLDDWNPTVAYKASTCVGYENLGGNSQNEFSMVAYPNPFGDKLEFSWTTVREGNVRLDLLDQYGNLVKTIYNASATGGVSYHVNLQTSSLPAGIYYYKFTSPDKVEHGKVVKQ